MDLDPQPTDSNVTLFMNGLGCAAEHALACMAMAFDHARTRAVTRQHRASPNYELIICKSPELMLLHTNRSRHGHLVARAACPKLIPSISHGEGLQNAQAIDTIDSAGCQC